MEWQMVGHLNMENEHCLKSKTIIDGIEVYRETITPINKASGKFGKAKDYYYVDTIPREFKTRDELLKYLKTLDK